MFLPTKFIEEFDPAGVLFWKFNEETSIFFNNPDSEGSYVVPSSKILRFRRGFNLEPGNPFIRLLALCRKLRELKSLHGIPWAWTPETNPDFGPSALELAERGSINWYPKNIPGMGNWLQVSSFFRPSSQMVSPASFTLEQESALIGFTITLATAEIIVSPMPPRSPRKWGRAWTPRWELEHAALVRQRKFARNQKKIEADNMKLRKRRTVKSRKRRAEKKRRDRIKLAAVPKACKVPKKYKVRRRSKRKK